MRCSVSSKNEGSGGPSCTHRRVTLPSVENHVLGSYAEAELRARKAGRPGFLPWISHFQLRGPLLQR